MCSKMRLEKKRVSAHFAWSRSKQNRLGKRKRNLSAISTGSKEFPHVFSKKIRLQIHIISNPSFPKGSDPVRMGNDQYPKALFLQSRHRQADAVHRDRSLQHHVTHNCRRRLNVECAVVSRSFPAYD